MHSWIFESTNKSGTSKTLQFSKLTEHEVQTRKNFIEGVERNEVHAPWTSEQIFPVWTESPD